jgi:CDP-4-dehydro-6-deoxyglucose reductase, E1
MQYNLVESSWGVEEIEALQEVIASDRFTMGERVALFEKNFAQKFGASYALMTSSGSTANLIGIGALFYKKEKPLSRRDEVIVPAVSWSTTYYPLHQYGLKLKFVDVELATLNLNISQLENALTPKTRMVVAVNILGNPCHLNLIRDFCDKHDLILFEDNCESLGAKLNGKMCGSFGDFGTFSFFFSHHIATMEGGMLITDNEEIFHIAKSMRAHGWTRDIPESTGIYDKSQDDFFEAYRFIFPGYNVRPLEMSGAVGLVQLKKVDEMIRLRRKNAEVFKELFTGDDRFIIQQEVGTSSWFSFVVILNPEKNMDRQRILTGLRDAGVEFRIVTGGNFLRHDVIKFFDYECVGDVKNANLIHDNGFFVGNFPRDLSLELNYFHKTLTGLIE